MIGVAILGCGYWGPNLLRNFYTNGDCRTQMVCDLNEQRLAHMKSLYPSITTTTSLDDVINSPDVDAVSIATPVRFHHQMAKKVLQAGKHVLIEKPMAASSAECEELINLAEQKGLVLMVGHTFIYSPYVRSMKQVVQRRDLGQIRTITARRLNLGLCQTDINVTWDLAPHDLSMILYLLGEQPVAVNCQGQAFTNPPIEDVTNLTVHFASGAFATVQSSWLDPNKIREMTVVGTKRMLVYDDTQPTEKVKIYDKRIETPPHYDTFAEFAFSYHYGDMYAPYIKAHEPLKQETQHFLDCIANGAKPETSGEEGLEVVRILEAASQSLAKRGGVVELKRTGSRSVKPVAEAVA